MGARRVHLLSHGSQLSGLWLQVIPSQAGHRMARAVFRRTLRIYFWQTCPGGASLATRRCHVCRIVVDNLCLHWLGTCPASRVTFTRRHSAIDYSIRAAFHDAGYTTTHEPSLLNPNPHQRSPRTPRGASWYNTSVIVAITCPSAPTFLASTRPRRGEAAQVPAEIQQVCYCGLRSAWGCRLPTPLCYTGLGDFRLYIHPKPAFWLDCHLEYAAAVRDR